MRTGTGSKALTSGGEEESHPGTPQGPSATGQEPDITPFPGIRGGANYP